MRPDKGSAPNVTEDSVPMTITDYTFPSRDLGVIVCVCVKDLFVLELTPCVLE